MNLPLVTVTDSSRATEELGHALADLIAGDEKLPRFVAMYGDLGVGKTAFVRGFCSEICQGYTVKSPIYSPSTPITRKNINGTAPSAKLFSGYNVSFPKK